MTGVLTVLGWSALAVLLLQVGTWLWSRAAGKLAVVDTVWGAGFALVGLVALLVGDGDLIRRVLLAVLVLVWGLRLSVHIGRRAIGKGEDPRYADMAERTSPAVLPLKVFGFQGLLQWFISLPVQVSAALGGGVGGWRVVLVLGVLVWGVGFVFEAVGDRQLDQFKADPDRGGIMDRGLWAWTRHPNYFGDACVWWGIWLVAASSGHWAAWLTVLAPLAMTHFLRNVSGAKLLEQSMRERDGFADYAQRTAYFFPRPPRR